MGLKSYRADWLNEEGETEVEFFEENKSAALRFAKKKAKQIETSVHVVFAEADTFTPSSALFVDQGEKVFHSHYPPHIEGAFV